MPRILRIRWFEDGTLNVCANCIDRHLPTRREPDRNHLGRRRPEGHARHHLRGAARTGLPLRQCAEGAWRERGDRVTMYLPMIPEAAIAMLAARASARCTPSSSRAFSPESLADAFGIAAARS